MRVKFLYLAQLAFTSAVVCFEPLIHQVRNRSERDIRQGGEKLEKQGDVIIEGLWDWHTYVIINVKLIDSDVDSYIF